MTAPLAGAERFDAVVVGGGVVGLFVAYELARRGLEVLVLEKRRLGGGVTSRSANVIHVIQPPPGRLRRRLCIEGNMLYRRYSRLLGFRVRWVPLVIAALSRLEMAYASLVYRLLRLLLPRPFSVSLIGGGEAAGYGLSGEVIGGVVVEGYGVVDPREVVDRLARGISGLGGEVWEGISATGVSLEGERILVDTSSGYRVRAYYLVNAAGLEAVEVASMVGDRFEERLYKGVMAVYDSPRIGAIAARLPRGLRLESKGGAAIPQVTGELLLGPTFSPATGKDDYSYTRGDVEELERRFEPLVGGLGRLRRVVVGVRPSTPNRDFVVARSSRSDRIVHLVGIESPGLTAAPAIARMVSVMIEGASAGARPR